MFHLSSSLRAIALRWLLPLVILALSACGREPSPPALPDLVETLLPAVVNISAVPAPGQGAGQSLGSGFVWLADGHIITNAHVVAHAPQGVVVKLHNRHEYPARLIGVDQASDLALLKIDAPDLTAVTVADATPLRVGMAVVAVGAPYGFDHTVTTGVLSAKARSLADDPYVPYLQTDAVISPGNSGGPLFDALGRVVGVNTQMLADRQGAATGVAFAIPIDVALRSAEALRDHGRVRRAWLGLVVEGLDAAAADALGLDTVTGAQITEVTRASPAAESGLRVGDVVLEIDGRPLRGSRELPLLIGQLTPGAMVNIELLRDGRPVQIRVELGETEPEAPRAAATQPPPSLWGAPGTPSSTPQPRESERADGAERQEGSGDNPLGIAVAALDAGQRNSIPLMSGGVRIVRVDGESAVRAGLRIDDLLLQVNGQAVNSPERFDEVVDRLTPEASVPLLVQRRGSPLFLTLDMPRRP
ncbi:trypsin-like peptidase domain-containing protein [Polycyclovorans algicola]|uniref:trypsin-like peptidase domain-containing protein n=1 Tax=Polycyclovorans algicola TaxID=616992 RepID=UPI0009FB9999|nr:trypsin-like peptidase domain-containing protein [Polycyclovorans algicola]